MPSAAKKKPLVIVTRTLPSAIETRLMELFETRLNADDKPMTASELIEAVKTADVLVPTVTDRIDSRVLSQAGPRLKLIASFGTGSHVRGSARLATQSAPCPAGGHIAPWDEKAHSFKWLSPDTKIWGI